MHITLIRKYKLPSECTYVCLEYPSYTGFAKRALWGRSSIVLYHNEQENLSMSQKKSIGYNQILSAQISGVKLCTILYV